MKINVVNREKKSLFLWEKNIDIPEHWLEELDISIGKK